MKKNISFFIVTSFIIVFGCKKEEEQKPELPDLSIVDISNESSWDYAVLGKEDYYFLKAKNNRPEAVLFHSKESEYDYSIFFNDDGFLDKIVVEDYVFSIRNPNGNKVDIGIVYPDGNLEILRQVETDFNWNDFSSKSIHSIQDTSDILRWTGRVVSAAPCVLSAAKAFATLGITIPLALWSCSNFLLGLSADIVENEFDTHNGFTEFINKYETFGTAVSCGAGLVGDLGSLTDCSRDLAASTFSLWADYFELIEENKMAEVQLIDAALEYGYGDVQVTLTWDNTADLDLHVIDPNGEEIYWDHTTSSSNGMLDVDDIDGFGPENIFWPKFKAPSGSYSVYVHMFPWEYSNYPSNANYTVYINAFGNIHKFSGHITYDQTIYLSDFNEFGFTMKEGRKKSFKWEKKQNKALKNKLLRTNKN
jgi:hypothetical protein